MLVGFFMAERVAMAAQSAGIRADDPRRVSHTDPILKIYSALAANRRRWREKTLPASGTGCRSYWNKSM
jgi:hypothetical protein